LELSRNLRPVINISLKRMTKNIQIDITDDKTGKNRNDKKADNINNLSAIGSKNFPNSETTLYFLAKKPSR
jgi:hypothetical protein